MTEGGPSTNEATALGAVGQYTFLEALPPSGPGDLYRARDTKHGRTVGVRLLPAGFTPTPEARAAFIERARPLVRMSHQNVTTLFDIGEHGGRVFVVFEFLVGQSLRAEMAGRPVRVRRALELAIHIADAVSEAHALGFAHRGLSPESVTVTARGHAKVPAFDLAVREGFETTAAGVRLKDYEAPEEARGDTPDDRSDVYSVGAILYEMLAVRRPNPKGSAAPSAANPHVSRMLDDVVLKAVSPNPESRYQTAASLSADLRGCLAALDAAGGSGDDEDVAGATGTSPGRGLLVVGAVVVLGVVLWWLTRS